MTSRFGFTPIYRWIEPTLALAFAAGLTFALWHSWSFGYLPPPFSYEPFDMQGDWFNFVYWAYDPGIYDGYGTFYPPFSLVFLRVFSLGCCYNIGPQHSDFGASLPSRSCDWLVVITHHVIYLLPLIIIFHAFKARSSYRMVPFLRSRRGVSDAGSARAWQSHYADRCIDYSHLWTAGALREARVARSRVGDQFKYYVIATIFAQSLRQLVFYSIPFTLAMVTITDVWRDINKQGWKSRWRIRRNPPVFVGAGTLTGASWHSSLDTESVEAN